MGFVPAESHEKCPEIPFVVQWLVCEVSAVKFKHQMGIFAELGVRVYIFENKALVKPRDKLVKKELSHVRSDVFTWQSFLLNEPPYFKVVVTSNPVVKYKQPHPHVLKRVDSPASIKAVILFNEIIENLSSVPNCLRQVTSERFKRIKNVEESRP